MTDQLVSSYRASVLLGRDRQTVERAVRHLVPDTYEGARPRWKLSRIADALAKPARERRDGGRCIDRYRIADARLDALVAKFEAQLDEITTEPSLDRRRELALTLAPLLREYQEVYLAAGRALRIDDVVLGARSDLIWSELISEVSAAAEWRGDGFSLAMIKAAWPDADGDEAAR